LHLTTPAMVHGTVAPLWQPPSMNSFRSGHE
jgi:hypothetical protein